MRYNRVDQCCLCFLTVAPVCRSGTEAVRILVSGPRASPTPLSAQDIAQQLPTVHPVAMQNTLGAALRGIGYVARRWADVAPFTTCVCVETLANAYDA